MRRQNHKMDPICTEHKQPIIKIELPTKRLLCEKCLNESDQDRKIRLEVARAELTNLYKAYVICLLCS